MKRVTVLVRPHRLEIVKSVISAMDVTGLTVTDVRGNGNSPESSHWTQGVAPLPIRCKIEVVVLDEQVNEVIDQVLKRCFTGESHDGKIFVEPILDAIRIRTRERGNAAI
jgi:nitrogen regulatory protein P-II 1